MSCAGCRNNPIDVTIDVYFYLQQSLKFFEKKINRQNLIQRGQGDKNVTFHLCQIGLKIFQLLIWFLFKKPKLLIFWQLCFLVPHHSSDQNKSFNKTNSLTLCIVLLHAVAAAIVQLQYLMGWKMVTFTPWRTWNFEHVHATKGP